MSDDQAARTRKLETDHQDAVHQQLTIQSEQIALRRMVNSALGSLDNNVGSVERQVGDVKQQVTGLVKRFDDNQLADSLDRDRQRAENEGRLGRMEGKITILIQSFLILALIGLLIIGYLLLKPS